MQGFPAMSAHTPSFKKWIILVCCCFWIAACNSKKRSRVYDPSFVSAVATFQQQLETIKQSENDTLICSGVRILYLNARSDIRDTVCTPMLRTLANLLISNTEAAHGIINFYRELYTDSSLGTTSKIKVCLNLANYYAHIEHNADSTAYYLQYPNQHLKLMNDVLQEKFYSIHAQLFQLQGNLKEAAANLYKSIALKEKTNDSEGIAANYVNLANVYRGMNDYAKAIELRKKSLVYLRNSMITIGGLAADYVGMEQLDSARKYFLEGEVLWAKEKEIGSPIAAYYLYLSKAGMYINLQTYDSAGIYFDKAKTILSLFDDPAQEMLFIITSSIAYSHERNVRQEAGLIEHYIPKLLDAGDLQGARDAYFSLYNIALVQKTNHEAIDYYLSYDSLKTILSDEDNRNFITEMESKYESQKKNLTIEMQQKEIKEKSTLNWILILSVITLILAATIIFARLQLLRSLRNTKLQQQFTQELLKNTEEERARIAGELHDGISHELLTLKNNLQEDQSVTEGRIDMIINNIRMIGRNMHPVMLDKIGLTYSIQYLCEQMMNGGNLFISSEIDYNRQLSPNDELQVYRIIQESLSNIIKYAEAIAARISITTQNNKLLLTIIDNGKGFDVSEKLQERSSFGLHSLIERGKALGGKTSIISSAQGTVIKVEISVKNA